MNATLKNKIGTLARRYLARLAKQRLELHQAVERLEAGHFYSLGDIYDLTHQIKGTAGTFGYHQIGRAASAIHDFALEVEPDQLPDRMTDLTGLMIDFDLAVSDAVNSNAERRGPPSRIKQAQQH